MFHLVFYEPLEKSDHFVIGSISFVFLGFDIQILSFGNKQYSKLPQFNCSNFLVTKSIIEFEY